MEINAERDHYISLAEASNLSPYSQEYLSLRARQGKLRAVKLGNIWFTTREWLAEYTKKFANLESSQVSEEAFQSTAKPTTLGNRTLFKIGVLIVASGFLGWIGSLYLGQFSGIEHAMRRILDRQDESHRIERNLSRARLPVSATQDTYKQQTAGSTDGQTLDKTVAGENDTQISGDLSVSGSATIQGTLRAESPSFIIDLGLSGNVIDFAGGGYQSGNQPQINLNQGGSRIFENRDLHLASDDYIYLDAPIATVIGNLLIPFDHNVSDVGSPAKSFRNGYFSGDFNVSGNYQRGSTVGQSASCSTGNTFSGVTVSGGILTSVGSCAALGGGGGSATLQSAYDSGNLIDTSDARDIDIVLANDTTDSNLDIDIEADNTVTISRLNNAVTEAPAQLLLLENLDTDLTVADGLSITAVGAITDAIDLTDTDIINALNIGDNTILGTTPTINFTNLDISGDGSFTWGVNSATDGIFNLSSTGDFIVQDAGTARLTVGDDGSYTFALPAGTVDYSVTGLDSDSQVIFSGLNSCDTIDTTPGGALPPPPAPAPFCLSIRIVFEILSRLLLTLSTVMTFCSLALCLLDTRKPPYWESRGAVWFWG